MIHVNFDYEDRYPGWEFTGRIKYKKYRLDTHVFLEIKYKGMFGKEKTNWVYEGLFNVWEETIQECSKK